jgi:hypothetical protein
VQTRRRLCPTLLGIVTLLVLTGCGGSSSSTTTTSTTSAGAAPTKAEYVARANAICSAAAPTTGKLLSELEGATTGALKGLSASGAAQLAALVGELHTGALTVLGHLQGLTVPTGEQAAVARFLTPLSHAIAGLGQAAKAITSGHGTQALGSLLELRSKTPQLASAAQAAGLTQCEGVLSGSTG